MLTLKNVFSCGILRHFCLFPCSWDPCTSLFWGTDWQNMLEMGKHEMWAARGLQAIRLRCIQVRQSIAPEVPSILSIQTLLDLSYCNMWGHWSNIMVSTQILVIPEFLKLRNFKIKNQILGSSLSFYIVQKPFNINDRNFLEWNISSNILWVKLKKNKGCMIYQWKGR